MKLTNTSKLLLGAALSVSVLAGLGATAFFSHFPAVEDAKEVTVDRTPERIARGAYLALNVAACVDCHSDRDFSRFSGPVMSGTEGKGNAPFGRELGIPGTVFARNITPAAVGEWSDGELIRAITEGVNAGGEALFPVMPYQAFAKMCRSDVEAIVAYLRTLEPVENQVPKRKLDFPLNVLVRTIPTPVQLTEECPTVEDGPRYGQYLLETAGCHDCHSMRDKDGLVPGLELAGGVRLDIPPLGIAVATANITPDVETGIGSWSKARFIGRFKAFADADSLPKLDRGDQQTLMPWTTYAGMTEEDLGAIYDYLMTVPPVKNRVDHYGSGPVAEVGEGSSIGPRGEAP